MRSMLKTTIKIHLNYSKNYTLIYKMFLYCELISSLFSVPLGLSPDLQSMEQIRRIMRPTDVPDTGKKPVSISNFFNCHQSRPFSVGPILLFVCIVYLNANNSVLFMQEEHLRKQNGKQCFFKK